MARYICLLLLGIGLAFANPIIITFINEVGIREDGQGWVELHSEPELGEVFDLNGAQLLTTSSVCTLSCSLRYDEFIIIDSAVLSQGIIGRGSFRLNPDSDRIVLIPPEPYPAERVSYPVIPTGWKRAPAPPRGGSIAIFNDGSVVTNWYIDSTPTPGEDNDNYSTIQGTVTWDSGLQVIDGCVIVSGDYGTGYWEIYPQPVEYQFRGLGAGRFWVGAMVYIVGHGGITVPYPESVDVGYSETRSGINIHISLQAIEEKEMERDKEKMSGRATIVKEIKKIMINDQSSMTILDASGRRVKEFDKVLAPGVYFVKEEKGRGLRKVLLVR
ncbi:MAG: hypothetical protein ABIK49_04585 [candidate division WOR-3 bacterium]